MLRSEARTHINMIMVVIFRPLMQVNMIVISVSIGESVLLYQTMRSESKIVMYIPVGFNDYSENVVKNAVKGFDAELRTLE